MFLQHDRLAVRGGTVGFCTTPKFCRGIGDGPMGPRRLLYGMARQRLAADGLTTQASCGWNCSNGPAIPAIPTNALPERSTSFGASGEGRDDAPSLGRSTYAPGVLNLSDKQMQKLVSACRTH